MCLVAQRDTLLFKNKKNSLTKEPHVEPHTRVAGLQYLKAETTYI